MHPSFSIKYGLRMLTFYKYHQNETNERSGSNGISGSGGVRLGSRKYMAREQKCKVRNSDPSSIVLGGY